MSPYILEIGARQSPYFRNETFSDILIECEKLLIDFASAPIGSRVVFLAASGTGAMEATVMNLLSTTDKAIVINGGGFGQRFVEMCNCHDIPILDHKVDGDNLADTASLDAYTGTTALLINAHETTNGTLYNMDAIGSYCKKNNLLHIVDAISMFVTDEINMTDQHIDALIISSHKGLALPPGLSMVILSPRAIERVGHHAKSLYFNFRNYLEDGLRGQPPFTPAVTILLQLHARLKQIERDTLNHEIDKTSRIAEYFRKHVSSWPLGLYSRFMPNAMTALTPTNDESALDIVKYLAEQCHIFVAPNGGALKDTVFRVSHMGDMTTDYVDVLIDALDHYYGVTR
ncbi:MAG: alanine--glyoxylate aminotransferase family protein [Methylobacter sp.]|nr:alanine--glyoxylate aminotransferase family protein [Methylobacter sp.]